MDPQNPNQPNNLQQQIPPSQTPDTHRLRTLSIVLLAAFLLSTVGIGVYFLGKRNVQPIQTSTNSVVETTPTPTLNPTANWKTFSDSSLDLTFKYPPNFKTKINKTDSNNWYIDIIVPVITSPQSGDNFQMTLTIAKNTGNISLTDYLREKYGQPTHPGGNPNFTVEGIFKDFKVTDVPLQNSYSYVGGSVGGPKESFFSFKDKFYTFALVGGTGLGAGYTQEAEKTFDQILSTFRFE